MITKAQKSTLAMLESRMNSITSLMTGISDDLDELQESGLDMGLLDLLNERYNQLRSAKTALAMIVIEAKKST